MGNRWLTAKEAAEYAGVNLCHIYDAAKAGVLMAGSVTLRHGHNSIGKRNKTGRTRTSYRFKVEDIDAWIMGRKAA